MHCNQHCWWRWQQGVVRVCDTCGGCRICGHQNSLGPARSSGLCQSLKPETDGGGGAGLWCTVAQFIWCIVVHAWCNAQRAAAAYNTGRLDNFPEVEQHQRRHNFEAQLIIFTTKRRIPTALIIAIIIASVIYSTNLSADTILYPFHVLKLKCNFLNIKLL